MFFLEGYQNLIKVLVSIFTVLLLFVVSFFKEGIALQVEMSASILGGLVLVTYFLLLKQSRWGKEHAYILSLPFSILIYGLLPGILVLLILEKGYRFVEKRWLESRNLKGVLEETDEEFYIITTILVSVITWLSTGYLENISPFLAAILFVTLVVLISEYVSEYVGLRRKEKIFIFDTDSFYLFAAVAMLTGLSARVINIYDGIVSLSFLFVVYSIIRFSEDRLSYPESRGFLLELTKNIESEIFEASNLSERISSLSCALGKELFLDEREISALNMISFLSVLLWVKFSKLQYRKPNELSEQEKKILAEEIKKTENFLQSTGFGDEIREALSSIYENFDGSGLPEGKRGDEIPLIARIVSVSETYQIITDGVSEMDEALVDDALKYIKSFEGKRFDPQVVRKLELISGIEPEVSAEKNAVEEGILEFSEGSEEEIESPQDSNEEGEEKA